MIEAMRVLANLLEGGLAGFLTGVPGPNPNAIPNDMTVQEYLDGQKIPRWYQKLLLRHARVSAAVKPPNGEPGQLVTVSGPLMSLSQGSLVNVNQEKTGNFKRDFDSAVRDAVDYVFAPDAGSDKAVAVAQALQVNRKSSNVREAANQNLLQDFIRLIGRSDAVQTPPKNLIVISHARYDGALGLVPTDQLADVTAKLKYEDIPRISQDLKLDDNYLNYRIEANKPPYLIFTGCSFGQAEPFLRKLRDAINPHLAAVAPKYMYGVSDENQGGMLETMLQTFVKYSPTTLTRAKLISQLQDSEYHDVHESKIDNGDWETWVPPEPWTEDWLVVRGAVPLWHAFLELELPAVTIGVDKTTFDRNPARHFREAVAAIRNPTHPLAVGHPYPIWKRFDRADANELLDTFEWVYQYVAEEDFKPTHVRAKGTAHRYQVCVPIKEQSPKPYKERFPLGNLYLPDRNGIFRVAAGKNDMPLPRLPLKAHGASNTQFWNAIEPSA